MIAFGIRDDCFPHKVHFSGDHPPESILTIREDVVEAFVKCSDNYVLVISIPVDLVRKFAKSGKMFVFPEIGIERFPLQISPPVWKGLNKNQSRSSVLVYPIGPFSFINKLKYTCDLEECIQFVVSTYSKKLPRECFVLEARETHLNVMIQMKSKYVISIPVSWNMCWDSRVTILMNGININLHPGLVKLSWKNRHMGTVKVSPHGSW